MYMLTESNMNNQYSPIPKANRDTNINDQYLFIPRQSTLNSKRETQFGIKGLVGKFIQKGLIEVRKKGRLETKVKSKIGYSQNNSGQVGKMFKQPVYSRSCSKN